MGRKEECSFDTGLFGKTYLAHYFSVKSPNFHKELNTIWKNKVQKTVDNEKSLHSKGKRIALAAPRGHAKSTVMSFQNTLHAALYGYKKYIILISDTEGQAVAFLDSIKYELEDNELILEDFGKQKGKVWKSTSIILENGCRIDALGSGQKLRGRRNMERRPDLIILDDIENDDDVRNPELRKKLASWYFGAVSKAGDYYTDLVFIGTILHKDSLLSNLLLNPTYFSKLYKAVECFSASPYWEQWEGIYCNLADKEREEKAHKFYRKHQKEMNAKTKVLWKEKLPYVDLMTMKLSDGEAAFNMEMQNTPIDRSSALFPEDWTSYYNPLEMDFSAQEIDFFGYCDPSLGKTTKSDYSAIIILAYHRKNGIFYVESADLQRRHPDKIIEDILESAKRINRDYGKKYSAFGAETNQFQWFLKEQLIKESAKSGLYLPICEVRSVSDKILRVQSLQPYIKNGYIKFKHNQTLLLNQLWDFPSGAYDDGPDALEGALKLAQKNSFSSSFKGLIV